MNYTREELQDAYRMMKIAKEKVSTLQDSIEEAEIEECNELAKLYKAHLSVAEMSYNFWIDVIDREEEEVIKLKRQEEAYDKMIESLVEANGDDLQIGKLELKRQDLVKKIRGLECK